jgi:hypothetical protein
VSTFAFVRPALGLLLLGGAIYGVLESGRGLRAPPPLAKTWGVVSDAGCLPETLTLSQSGVYLHATSGDLVLRGKLDGERARFDLACGDGSARFTGTWTAERLSAHAERSGCGCAGELAAEPAK